MTYHCWDVDIRPAVWLAGYSQSLTLSREVQLFEKSMPLEEVGVLRLRGNRFGADRFAPH
jgi:hypothetical protein